MFGIDLCGFLHRPPYFGYNTAEQEIPKKASVNLSSGRSVKRQNTQNRYFLFFGVITKIRGIDGKSHKSMQNMIITSDNISICWNMDQETTKFMHEFCMHQHPQG
jgi:hypothetical protein